MVRAQRSAVPSFEPPAPPLPLPPAPQPLLDSPLPDTEEKGGAEPALTIEKPDDVLEVFILKGRNIPCMEIDGSANKVTALIQYGDESYQSLPSWPTTDPVWNESVQFAVHGYVDFVGLSLIHI